MPGCPHCGRQWPEGYQRCPDDGVLLIVHVQSGGVTGGAMAELAPAQDDDLPVGSYAIDRSVVTSLLTPGGGSNGMRLP